MKTLETLPPAPAVAAYPQNNFIVSLWLLGIAFVVLLSLIRIQSALLAGDKWLHFLGYAALSLLPLVGFSRLPVAITASLSMNFLGVALEFLQLLTPWRGFEVYDMLANAVGVFAGVAAGALLRRALLQRMARRR